MVGVEKNMDSFSVTGHIRGTVVLVCAEASQTGSISIGYFNVIILTGMLNLKIWGGGVIDISNRLR